MAHRDTQAWVALLNLPSLVISSPARGGTSRTRRDTQNELQLGTSPRDQGCHMRPPLSSPAAVGVIWMSRQGHFCGFASLSYEWNTHRQASQ